MCKNLEEVFRSVEFLQSHFDNAELLWKSGGIVDLRINSKV